MTAQSPTTDDVTSTVHEILERVLLTSPAELAGPTQLSDFTWDSLTTLETMIAVESALGIRIDLRELHTVRTVNDLVELVRRARSGV
jgi:acyl carrier protein